MFEFSTATKIIFGRGSSAQLGNLARGFGGRALVVTGATPSRVSSHIAELERACVSTCQLSVSGEPRIDVVVSGVTLARQHAVDVVVGIGGGSAIDAAKAIAALTTNHGDPLDYLEVVGRGLPLVAAPMPFIAVPTTAGTGAEVTKNAVLCSTEHGVKVSLRSDSMLPDVAVVDSQLTHSVSREVTVATGLDALTQVIEPYVSRVANPLTDALCIEAIRRARVALPRVVRDGNDAEARDDMALVSLFGGLALANAKLGAVHGFAGPLGGMYDAPHGAICARLLPEVMEHNAAALQRRQPDGVHLRRYLHVAQILTGDDSATIADGVRWVRRLVDSFDVPKLGSYGVRDAHIDDIVTKAARASSMKGNPIELDHEELAAVLRAAI